MESERFDALARRASDEAPDASRRSIVLGGVTALAASALAVVGRGDAADAKKKKGPNKKRNSGNSNKRKRQMAICYRGETQVVRRGQFQDGWFEGATQGACVCGGTSPISCGTGCCPNEFPQCCPPTAEQTGEGGKTSGNDVSVCAPNTSRCCTVANGGGACDSPTPQCCPPTNGAPRGACAPVDATCCTNAQGGGVCFAPFTQCCPPSPANFPFGNCCRPGQQCCTGPVGSPSNCPAGLVCNINGCCTAGVLITSGEEDGAPRQTGAEKVGISA